mgnify:CR=1 FL=1
MIDKDKSLQNLLIENGAILKGHFLLTSGRHSDRYIEKFRVLENPDALDTVCLDMSLPFKSKNIDCVMGAAIGGILIAGGVGKYLGVKHIFSERVNGKMTLRRGFTLLEGMRIVIVEDVITTGGSVFELIDLAKSYKVEIVGIISLVERANQPIDFGYNSHTLLRFPVVSWEVNKCPLCNENIPLTNQGRTGK